MAPVTTLVANSPQPVGRTVDILVVNAESVGLFAVFQVGMLDLPCVLVDTSDRPGGQCTELYLEKPIYDIPALASYTTQELADRLVAQCVLSSYPILCDRGAETVGALKNEWDRHLRVITNAGDVFDCAVVLIMAGNGASIPQCVALSETTALEGYHLHYAVCDTAHFAGKRAVTVGGGDSTLNWALALCKVAAHTTLIHR